jgi:6-phospho-beta-glucosidase
VAPERVAVDQVGLNHLTWVRAVRLDGADVLGELLSSHGDQIAEEIELPRRLLDELGAVPSYYLRYFYLHDEVLAEMRQGRPRALEVAEIERELLGMYADPELAEKPALLEHRGGAFYSEAATGLIASLASSSGDVHVVDVRNIGTLAGLADDDVVEVPARIEAKGALPLIQKPLAPEMLSLVQDVAAYDRLTVQAAISGDRAIARKALLAHPLIGRLPVDKGLLEGLLEAGAPHLSQYFRGEKR